MGTGPFFGGESCLARKTSSENMDLSPFAAQGGQSHFRGENVNSLVTSFPPRKLGQSPVNGYGCGAVSLAGVNRPRSFSRCLRAPAAPEAARASGALAWEDASVADVVSARNNSASRSGLGIVPAGLLAVIGPAQLERLHAFVQIRNRPLTVSEHSLVLGNPHPDSAVEAPSSSPRRSVCGSRPSSRRSRSAWDRRKPRPALAGIADEH